MLVIVTAVITINQHDPEGITLLQRASVSPSLRWTYLDFAFFNKTQEILNEMFVKSL